MVHLGFLMNALYGATTVASGLACTPTVPASMQVTVGQGAMISMQVVDASAFGSLPSDSTPLVKLGSNLSPTTFNLTAPSTSGQSINYLIEGSFVETDNTPVVLPYFNAANPAQAFSGPNNSGTPQNTKRAQVVSLQLKAGAAANAGTQATPAVDIGWVGLYVVTVNFGQNTITNTSISTYPNAPFLAQFLQSHHGGVPGQAPKINLTSEVQNPLPLANLPSAGSAMVSNMQVFTSPGTFTVPAGVTKVRAIVTSGGGGGAGATTTGSVNGGGGGAGATAIGLYSVTPGSNISIAVGSGGAAGAAGQNSGSAGGTSSFGSFCSASGGVGGANGPATVAGGSGGTATGGGINIHGGMGSAGGFGAGGISFSGHGGASYWGGGGQASTVSGNFAAQVYGSGGGAGVNGNISGNLGAPGIVVLEW